MEYIILAVVIAAGCVLAVVLLSRAVTGMFITASTSTTLQHSKAKEEHDMRVEDRKNDAEKARRYHDVVHY